MIGKKPKEPRIKIQDPKTKIQKSIKTHPDGYRDKKLKRTKIQDQLTAAKLHKTSFGYGQMEFI